MTTHHASHAVRHPLYVLLLLHDMLLVSFNYNFPLVLKMKSSLNVLTEVCVEMNEVYRKYCKVKETVYSFLQVSILSARTHCGHVVLL